MNDKLFKHNLVWIYYKSEFDARQQLKDMTDDFLNEILPECTAQGHFELSAMISDEIVSRINIDSLINTNPQL